LVKEKCVEIGLATMRGIQFGVIDKGNYYFGEEIYKFMEKKDEVYL
jgi:hypothetical protein